MAGGVLSGGGDLQKAFDAGWTLNGAFRALETSGKPIAAAINGLALGGGLEFTLAAHYRVVENDNKIQLGPARDQGRPVSPAAAAPSA